MVWWHDGEAPWLYERIWSRRIELQVQMYSNVSNRSAWGDFLVTWRNSWRSANRWMSKSFLSQNMNIVLILKIMRIIPDVYPDVRLTLTYCNFCTCLFGKDSFFPFLQKQWYFCEIVLYDLAGDSYFFYLFDYVCNLFLGCGVAERRKWSGKKYFFGNKGLYYVFFFWIEIKLINEKCEFWAFCNRFFFSFV